MVDTVKSHIITRVKTLGEIGKTTLQINLTSDVSYETNTTKGKFEAKGFKLPQFAKSREVNTFI